MTDMIERVRLALKASLDDSLRGAGVDPKGWHMTDAAKAAIAAMREPTDEMIERVALAICANDEDNFEADPPLVCTHSCVACRNMARAAIAAWNRRAP